MIIMKTLFIVMLVCSAIAIQIFDILDQDCIGFGLLFIPEIDNNNNCMRCYVLSLCSHDVITIHSMVVD